ncbi:hypothetical protein N7497_008397 [Penicillium chrysogenum]|nr:hypothetical protein N7497_008397 [Penicillium chrysogenum]
MASQSAIQESLQSYKTTSTVDDFHKQQDIADTTTGGGDGIGLALVKAVVEFGGHVAVIDYREVPHLDLCEIQVLHKESRVKYFSVDITNEMLVTKAFDGILAEFGRIDGVIACAGVCVEKPFVDHTWEEVVRLQMVNSVGLFFAVQLAVKAMLKNQPTSGDFTPKGSVILIGSIATESGVESQGLTAYSASKGAANGLLRGLAVELAPMGIRVNMISPRAHCHRHVYQSIHESSGVGYDHAECCSYGTDGRSQGSQGCCRLFPVGCIVVYYWK